ncbi:MAG: glycosyltransferase family 2 protein [Phycisphaerales bacterium]|nr:glycosyltransferase family 2 protein [Phycisphaerales bacterium]
MFTVAAISTILQALLLASVPLSLGATLWWFVAILKMVRTRQELGTASEGRGLADGPGRVVVVIPAHNEQQTIGPLIDSLKAQDHASCRFVLALDRCTDNTLPIAIDRIAGDERFTLHEIAECPEGWAGKVHAIDSACRSHAQDAEFLVFADADTVFHPACVRASVNLLRSRGLGMLSLLSTLTFLQPFERRVQGPAMFELMRRYPPTLASRDTNRRAFANGQFMLWTRDAYNRVGTHAAFRSELLEDIAMARAAWREKLRVHVIPAGEMLRCRMYPDAAAFRRGWRRIFIESANRKPRRLISWARAVVIRGAVVPLSVFTILVASLAIGVAHAEIRSSALLAGWTSSAALFAWCVGIWTFMTVGGVPRGVRWRVLLTWPCGSLTLASILREGAAELRSGVPTAWGGLQYNRPAR